MQTIKAREDGGGGAMRGNVGVTKPGLPGIIRGGVGAGSGAGPLITPNSNMQNKHNNNNVINNNNVPLSAAGVVGGISSGGDISGSGLPGTQQYNRYDQERFSKADVKDAIGFNIETTSTFHGLTLKSVTEGSAQPKVPLNDQRQNGGVSAMSSSHKNGSIGQGKFFYLFVCDFYIHCSFNHLFRSSQTTETGLPYADNNYSSDQYIIDHNV